MKSASGKSSKSSAKPFAGHGTKTFLGLVRNLEKEARTVSPDSDDALCRAAAVKAVLLGFTCLGQLASTLEVDVLGFIPSPATRALFMHMVAKATERHAAYKKRKDFVLEAQASSSLTLAPVSCAPTSASMVGGSAASSARVGGSAASAETLSSTVKTLDAEQLQISVAKVLASWDVPVDKGTPTATIKALTAAQAQCPQQPSCCLEGAFMAWPVTPS